MPPPSGFTVNANVSLNPQSLNVAAKQLQQSLGRITGQASEFQKSLDASTARVFAFGATTSVLNGINQSFKAIVSTTIAVEKRLIELQSILGGTTSEFNVFRNTVFNVAKTTGQSFDIVADAAAELARQGLNAEETAKRLESALVLTRVSGLDSVKAVKALTSAINGFTSAGLTAQQITNKLVAVDTSFAVSAQDLAEAFSRAGSTAEDAGVSFDELLGIVTAVEQTTARGGAVIGNALKSIFSRLGRGKVIDELQELGVQIDSSQTGVQKLQALSSAIQNISDPTVVQQIKELAGGVYQINIVSAALKDLGSDTSIFAKAAQTASTATNEAFEKNAKLNQSISAQINTLVLGLTNLAEKVGQLTFAPVLKSLISLANTFTGFLEKALDPEMGNKFVQGLFKVIGSFLSGPGLVVFTTAFLKIFTIVARFAKDGLKSVFEIGSQSEKIKVVESGIVDLLSRDRQLRQIIASSTATQAQKEQAVIAAIQRENALLTQQEQLLQSIATSAMKRGVSGFNISTGFTGKGGKRFASGFMQEEAMAMMLGASKGVKAKYGKGTIGGQRFIMNNQETEIPNFGRNGDSAVIPHYASGFVPNYASPYAQMIAIARKARTGKFPTVINDYGDLSAAQANAAAKRGRKVRDFYKEQRKAESAKSRSSKILNLNTDGSYGMIVPEIGSKSFKDVYISQTDRGIAALEGNTPTANTVARVSVPIYRLNKAGAKYKESSVLQKEFTDLFTKEALSAAHSMSGGQLPKPAREAEIRNTLNKGSAASAAGSVFESAIAAMLNDNDFQDFQRRAVGSLMDFTGSSVANLSGSINPFGIRKGTIGLEAKHSSDLAGGAAEKIHKILAPQSLGGGRKAFAYKNTPKAASGYIPNFNSMNKGVPVSQIRAHFDKSGSPIAVTNTRDEPNGLKDAIGREKKGVGMYAKGFIPNYIKAQDPSFGKFLAFQSIILSLQQLTGNFASANESLKGFSTAVDYSITALSMLQSIDFASGGKVFGKLAKFLPSLSGAMSGVGSAITGGAGAGTVLTGGLGAGAAIGAGALAVGTGVISYKVGEAISEKFILGPLRQAEEELAKQEKGLMESRINIGLSSKGLSGENIKNTIESAKNLGLDSDKLSTVYRRAINIYNESFATEKDKDRAIDSATKAYQELKQSIYERQRSLDEATESERQVKSNFENFKNALQKRTQDLDKLQLQTSSMGRNLSIASALNTGDAAYSDAVKRSIEGQLKINTAQDSGVQFSKLLSGEKFAGLLGENKIKVQAGEIPSLINTISKAASTQGPSGVDKILDQYLDTSKEDYADFRNSVMEAAQEFQNNITDAATFQKNSIKEVESQRNQAQKEYNQKVLEYTQKMDSLLTALPNKLKDILSRGPVDISKIGSVYEQAAKAKDPLEAARILANNADLLSAGETALGSKGMAGIARVRGFSQDKQVGAISAANLSTIGGFQGLTSGLFGPNFSPTLVNKALGKGISSVSDIDALKQSISRTQELTGRGDTGKIKAVQDILDSIKEQVTGEEGGAKKEMDEATKKFKEENEKFTKELATLAETYKKFGESLMAKDVVSSVDRLSQAVDAAAKNAQGFTDFTKNLNSLSTTLNARLESIESRLGQTNL